MNEFYKRILSSIILIPIVFFCIFKGALWFNFFLVISFLITFYEWHKIAKNKKYYIFGFFFLIFSFYTVFELRNSFNDNYWFVIFIILICMSTDIGGYIFGKIFKGPKLIKISPNKTYSGMIGSYILTFIILFFYLENTFFLVSIDLSINLYVFIFLISTVSQLGDLIISYFKRSNKLKNTGNIIPGHGGLLDRIDGMVFAFPFAYLVVSIELLDLF